MLSFSNFSPCSIRQICVICATQFASFTLASENVHQMQSFASVHCLSMGFTRGKNLQHFWCEGSIMQIASDLSVVVCKHMRSWPLLNHTRSARPLTMVRIRVIASGWKQTSDYFLFWNELCLLGTASAIFVVYSWMSTFDLVPARFVFKVRVV